MESRTYSIVIPAYNESQRIGETLQKILAYVAREHWTAEVLVVNDGSRDDTAAIVRRFAQQNPAVRLLENPGNRGKGYSVRHGMSEAQGDIVFFSDADLSSPITEAPKLLSAIQSGADVAIGSRWLQSELQTERQPLYRQFLGRIFNVILHLFLGLRFKDTQCGFKAFTHRAALAVFPRQRIEHWGFDPEILFLAKKAGLNIQEVPVEWRHDVLSKINPVTDGLRMFFEILRIRWNDLSGKYAASAPPPLAATK